MKAIRRIAFVVAGTAAWILGSSVWGQVVINEFVDDERTASAGQTPDTREFVELYNAGGSTVDISGWTLTTKQIGSNFNLPAGTVTYTLPASQSIAAGGFYVIGVTGVPNLNYNPGAANLLPDGAATPTLTNGNYVMELRNTATALVDAVADETFRGTERANLNAEQLAQVGGGWWGQDPSFDVTAPNAQFSNGRFLNGRDTNVNGYDFGMLPLTPGASNNLPQNVSHTIPNVDSLAQETTLESNYYASFVLPRVVDPTVADGIVNPTSIPASPQGGKAIMAYDESGGGNASYSKELVRKFDLYAYIETGALNQTSLTDTQDHEATIYGIGTTDGLFGTPNPAGLNTVTSSSNGSTGYGWMIQRVEDFNGGAPTTKTRLMLVDFDDSGDSISTDNEWQVMRSIDLSASASAWHRLSIDYNPTTGVVTAKNDAETITFTEAGDYNNDGKVDGADYVMFRKNQGSNTNLPNNSLAVPIGQAHYDKWRAQFGHTSTPGLVGNFYVGYRENILDLGGNFSTARPPTYDMIGGPGFGQLVPEPSAIVLALGGVLLTGAKRRRGGS